MARHNKLSFVHNGGSNSRRTLIIDLAKIIGVMALSCISIPSYGNGVIDAAARTSIPSNENNEKPIAKNDLVYLNKSSTAFNALGNDFDPNGDQLTLISATANFGAVAFTPEGLLAYAQGPGQPRADKITYTVSDGRGGVDQGVVEIALPSKRR